MEKLTAIFSWLDGKKNYIASVLLLTNSFLGLKGVFDTDTVAYVAAMVGVLMTGAEYTTVKLGARQ